MRKAKLVSVIAPAYNEEEILPHFYQRLTDIFSKLNCPCELVIVDNGSADRSLAILKDLHQKDKRLRYISLSRNFGHQGGLMAGLTHARGDAVICMDADLQHPPELIPAMVRKWEEDFDIVYTVKRESAGFLGLRRLCDRAFYRLMTILSGIDLHGQSDFRLMDRLVVDVVTQQLPERRKFLRGLIQWVGYRQTGLEYEVQKRHAGRSKFNFRQLFNFAVDGIFSFSIVPLRVFTIIGFFISLSSLLYGISLIVLKLYAAMSGGAGSYLPPGWATLASVMLFFGGVQLIGIGLLGEYLGRVYDEVKARPVFLVRESSAGMATGQER